MFYVVLTFLLGFTTRLLLFISFVEKVGEGWRRLETVRERLRMVEKDPKIARTKLLRTATREALSGLSGEKRERVSGCPPGPLGSSPHCFYYPVLSLGSVNYSHSTFIIMVFHLFTTRCHVLLLFTSFHKCGIIFYQLCYYMFTKFLVVTTFFY